MSKQNKSRTSKRSTILVGSAAGILVGWLLNKYGKSPAKRAFLKMNQKVKETQNRWYTDGEKRASDIAEIKRDVESNL